MRCSKAAAILTLACAVSAQTPPSPVSRTTAPADLCAAKAGRPIVELKGTISRVELSAGESTPYIEITSASGTATRVRLGSLRFLMERNFNPRMRQEAVVRGFHVDKDLIAVTVRIPAEKISLRFRDENGCPLWMAYRNKAKGL